jgi:DNA processing protein
MLGVGAEGPVGIADSQPPASGRLDRPARTLRPVRAMDQSERDAWAVLATVDGLGPAAFAVLLAGHGTAAQVLEVARSARGQQRIADTPPIDGIRDHGAAYLPINEDVAAQIVDAAGEATTIVARVNELGLEVVTIDDAHYPGRLRDILLPPAVLFVLGDAAALSRARATAVVGTRHPSSQGRMTAARISRALAASSATVVSGLALGIDGAAHEATVRAGGITVAVLGSGLGVISPPSHRRLAEAIVASGGAVVSELGPDVHPGRGTFPRRNRLISGLSDATIVVEAPASSGALLTAGWALDQGRACFVVPGPIDAPTSAGCLSFLHQFHGEARIVTGVPQLIADLGYAGDPEATSTRPIAATLQLLGSTEARVADAILAGRVTVDELVAVTGLSVATILATLTLLERQGLIVGTYGRYRPAGTLLEPPVVPPRR